MKLSHLLLGATLALSTVGAFGQSSPIYSNITITGTAAINLLYVAGPSAFGAGMGVGPGSSDNISQFGATLWTGGPDSYYNPMGSNMMVIGSSDSPDSNGTNPIGFVFKLLPDDNGNTIPVLLANWLGNGSVPLDLNTDWGPSPAPVLVGTYDWDGQSMFQVSGTASFSGPVEIQPQGDISMGSFTSMPPQSNNDAVRAGGGMARGGMGLSGTNGQ